MTKGPDLALVVGVRAFLLDRRSAPRESAAAAHTFVGFVAVRQKGLHSGAPGVQCS